jgi:hypothetical protein
LVSKEQTFVEPPIIVDLPAFVLEATINPHPISVTLPSSEVTLNPPEPSTETDFMITTDLAAENEQPIQTGTILDSSSPFVLEFVRDAPFVPPNQSIVIENSSTYTPSSSTTIAPQLTNVSPPPTLLLESDILKEVCENIFKDLNKLVQTRSNFVHQENYVDEWTSLRERVDFVMCELQKLSLEAYNQALNTLKDWFKEVVGSMEEVNVNMNQEKSKLYI